MKKKIKLFYIHTTFRTLCKEGSFGELSPESARIESPVYGASIEISPKTNILVPDQVQGSVLFNPSKRSCASWVTPTPLLASAWAADFTALDSRASIKLNGTGRSCGVISDLFLGDSRTRTSRMEDTFSIL